MKNIILIILAYFPFLGWSQNIPMFVGTYTSNTTSKGIYAYEFNTTTGDIELKSTIRANNPSFLARNNNFIYAVSEQDKGNGSISSYTYANNKFTLLNSVPTKGDNPCHVSVSPNKNMIVASNYSGGSFITYALESNGVIGNLIDFVQHEGKGLDKERQDKPHVHSAFFSKKGNQLFVQDLGLDQISVYQLIDHKKSTVKLATDPIEVFSPAGGGVRHIALDKSEKYLYAILEMTGEVAVFKRDGDDWLFHQTVEINPEGFTGENGSSELKISPDGKFLYAANRGTANTIGIFSIAKDGMLTKVANQKSLGIAPRNFNLSPDGKFLLVGNHRSNEIVVFSRDSKTGLLTDTGKRTAVPVPVCIIF